MRLVVIAIGLLIAGYAPLLVVGYLDPTANPIGLGLLAMVASFVAAALLAIAGIRGVWRLLR